MIGRAIHILRSQGPLSLFFKILGELGYRRLFLYTRRLPPGASEPSSEPPLEFGLLTPDEIDDHVALLPNVPHREIETRLRAGHVCTTARMNGELVAVTWAAAGRAWVEYLGLHVRLPPGVVYGYQTYVAPGFRRCGAASELTRMRTCQLVSLGHRIELSAAMPENAPALRLQHAVGRKMIGLLRVFWAGPFRWASAGLSVPATTLFDIEQPRALPALVAMLGGTEPDPKAYNRMPTRSA